MPAFAGTKCCIWGLSLTQLIFLFDDVESHSLKASSFVWTLFPTIHSGAIVYIILLFVLLLRRHSAYFLAMRLMQFVQLFGLKFMEKLICAHQNSFAVFIARYCPYVCLYVTRVDYTKTVEDRIMKFLPHGSPIPLVSSVNSNWFPLARASNKGGVGKTSYFQAKCVDISKTLRDTHKVTIND